MKRRGAKRERTRTALIEAFWAVVETEGYAAASLEAVARRAGMSRGAIYSNFPSRAALLLAAAGTRGLDINRDFSRPGTLHEQLTWFAEDLVRVLPNAPGTQRWHAEIMVHIAGDPALKAYVASAFAGLFQTMADQLEAQHRDSLAIAPATLALTIQAMTMGFVYQAILSPHSIPASAVIEAFQALAAGAAARHAAGDPRRGID